MTRMSLSSMAVWTIFSGETLTNAPGTSSTFWSVSSGAPLKIAANPAPTIMSSSGPNCSTNVFGRLAR